MDRLSSFESAGGGELREAGKEVIVIYNPGSLNDHGGDMSSWGADGTTFMRSIEKAVGITPDERHSMPLDALRDAVIANGHVWVDEFIPPAKRPIDTV